MAGNQMKMRETLIAVRDALDTISAHEDDIEFVRAWIAQTKDAVQEALSEPPRQCDVGTAVEQESRWRTNCGYGIPNCKHCKVYEEAKNSGLVNGRYLMRCDCRFIWAQMPHGAEEGAGK